MSADTRQPGSDSIQVAMAEQTAFVSVRGRGSFKVSPALKDFGAAAMKKGVTRFVFDMRECIGMDSTFMGVLAGLAFRLREKDEGAVIMINLNTRTRGLLNTLGLDQVIQPYMTGATPKELDQVFREEGLSDLETSGATRRETTETMLKAHETLVELCPENLPKFKDVLTYLREDLKRDRSEGREGE